MFIRKFPRSVAFFTIVSTPWSVFQDGGLKTIFVPLFPAGFDFVPICSNPNSISTPLLSNSIFPIVY